MKYLEKLARIFQDNGSRVYAVGGFVRKVVAGDDTADVDLCGALTPSEVIKLLEQTEFECLNKNDFYLKLTIKAKANPRVYFEYTTFRKDTYSGKGGHHPTAVKQVKTIRLDHARRDFTINAIYFDPLTKEYFDYCGGLIDLKHRLLKTIIDPDTSFANDPLRIIRMIRIAVDGPYNIEFNTFSAAKRQAKLTDTISETKMQEEYNKIKNKTLANKLLKEIFEWKKPC